MKGNINLGNKKHNLKQPYKSREAAEMAKNPRGWGGSSKKPLKD